MKKCLAVGIILLFIGTCIIPSAAQDTNKPSLPTLNDFFGLQSIINISWDANQTSEPLRIDFARAIPLNVTYNCIKSNFGQFILFYYMLTRQSINISLEVEDKPSWCHAYLSSSHLHFPITGTSTTYSIHLVIAVGIEAPAFEPFSVKIKASAHDMIGPLGFLTLINGVEITQDIIFEAEYVPSIGIIPESVYLETQPGNTVIDPITVGNFGNGKTIVDIEPIDVPQNWLVIINPLILEVNESKITNLSITPPIDFYGNETILLSFTPKFYYNPIYTGIPIDLLITVEVRP
jgi:hypothetical protein